jgi:hypothetical protein
MAVRTTDILSPRLQEQRDALADRFRTADPFPHLVIPEFFAPGFANRLLDDFPPFEERFALNELGEVGGKAVQTDVRAIGEVFRELDDFIQTPEFLGLISDMTGIPDLLYDPEYVGGGTHENLESQALDPHVDFNYHPGRGWHRRLNLIVYLNPEWDESWGGNLDLHSNPWDADNDQTSTVLPLFNQAVLFETSERSWHGFSPLQIPEDRQPMSRRSFAIYLYTKERPADEIAAAHATVYVPPAMPDEIKPGQVLSDEDYEEIKTRFATHLGYLRFLYGRELKFNTQIASLSRALEDARSNLSLALQGYATQTRAPTGWWPDGWAGKDFSLGFSGTRPVRALKLEIWVPPQLESGQLLEIEAGEWSDKQELGHGTHVLDIPVEVPEGEDVEVSVRAQEAWSPKAAGASSDDRSLAYKLISAKLEH